MPSFFSINNLSVLALISCLLSQTHAQQIKADEVTGFTSAYPTLNTQIQWIGKGHTYLNVDHNGLSLWDYLKKKPIKTLMPLAHLTLLDQYISSDELIVSANHAYCATLTHVKALYRHSYSGRLQVYSVAQKTWFTVSDTLVSNPTFSPDSKKIAYIKKNNLYVFDLESLSEKALTTDGSHNAIINGKTDWSYEEEFGYVHAYVWNSTSSHIVYQQFDERLVPAYTLQYWDTLYTHLYTYRYPKVDQTNVTVHLKSVEIQSGHTLTLHTTQSHQGYMPRFGPTFEPHIFYFFTLNRNQDTLTWIHVDLEHGKKDTLYQEFDPYYVDMEATFNKPIYHIGTKTIFFISEKSGYKQVYTLDPVSKVLTQHTNNRYEIDQILGIDNQGKNLVLQTRAYSPITTTVTIFDVRSGESRHLSNPDEYAQAQVAPDFSVVVGLSQTFQSIETWLWKPGSAQRKTLETDIPWSDTLTKRKFTHPQTAHFLSSTGDTLYYWLIKPYAFSPEKKYPILFYLYGGPGSQQINLSYNYDHRLWFQYMASKGYIIACLDNRGTGGRGAAFKKQTTRQLGKLEAQDQIEFARYIATIPFADSSQLGIWGWSYGGYLAGLCMLQAPDLYKAAVSVAPVTHWRFYDSIYTERYMKSQADNSAAYTESSLQHHAHKLSGAYLVIHGTADDNVHVQHSLDLQKTMIKHQKQAEFYYYPDKAHGIGGKTYRTHLYQKITRFFDTHLTLSSGR